MRGVQGDADGVARVGGEDRQEAGQEQRGDGGDGGVVRGHVQLSLVRVPSAPDAEGVPDHHGQARGGDRERVVEGRRERCGRHLLKAKGRVPRGGHVRRGDERQAHGGGEGLGGRRVVTIAGSLSPVCSIHTSSTYSTLLRFLTSSVVTLLLPDDTLRLLLPTQLKQLPSYEFNRRCCCGRGRRGG